MKRLFAAALLPALLLTACSGAAGRGTPSPPPVAAPAPDTTTKPAPDVKPEKPPEAPIRWYVPGIGLPMKSDDPRAVGKKVVMLTFDDGPTTDVTPQILDTLKENNVKAMFFVTGYGAAHKDLVEREIREGHTVGTHTMNHDDLTKMSVEQMRREIVPVNDIVAGIAGKQPVFFRPPYGSYNSAERALVKDLGMQLINWSDGSRDWESVDKNGWKDPNKVVADTMEGLHPGAVILMHDTHKHTAEALPLLIKRLKAEGYEFAVIS